MSDLVASNAVGDPSTRSGPLAGLNIPGELAMVFDLPSDVGTAAVQSFERCVAGYATSLQPRDAVEWVLIRDLADLQSDIDTVRRAMVVLLAGSRQASIAAILSFGAAYDGDRGAVVKVLDVAEAGDAIPASDVDATAEYEKVFRGPFRRDDPIGDVAFATQARVIEQLEAAAVRAMAFRDRILAEFDWRRRERSLRSHALRTTVDAIIDAEFRPKMDQQ